MSITAIIPTYKRPHFLKRAIRSVLQQTFPHFHLLVADNASQDETEEVVAAFMRQDPRVKLLKHRSNIGMTANFQAALDNSTTPFVCFLPDDDFFGPTFFEEVLPFFDTHPEIAFCGGGGFNIDQNYTISSIELNGQTIPPSGYYHPPDAFFAYIRGCFGISFPSLLFRREVLNRLGGFDRRLKVGIDEDLVSKCATRFPVYLLTNRPFYFGFQHEHNLSKKGDCSLYEQECLYLYDNLKEAPFSRQQRKTVDLFFQERHLKILSSGFKQYCTQKQFLHAARMAEKLTTLGPSRRWERKKKQALLFERLPFLAPLYERLKALERAVRCKHKKEVSSPTVKPLEEAGRWKEYARQLSQQ